ncbi:MAG TPA: cytochrome c oxidase assembly factor Coa1 family protein [Xanthobacteraceae bacterium]|nr:cytochrome c oxidase assembly factor Coa1 family protein [Xanthobacteraceae bacterium]
MRTAIDKSEASADASFISAGPATALSQNYGLIQFAAAAPGAAPRSQLEARYYTVFLTLILPTDEGTELMSSAQGVVDPHPIPPEIDRWNWGAFLLNWIWGVGNNTFIALLAIIPLFGFVMMFVLGAKGSRWAWRNGRWDSVEHFKRVQRKWAIWGAIIWIASIVLFAGIFVGVFSALKHSEAYQLGVSRLQSNPIATSILGTPISAGTPSGKIAINGDSGRADLSFTASGPRTSGVVIVEAVKKDGVWSLTRLTLKPNGSDKAIDLIGGRNDST